MYGIRVNQYLRKVSLDKLERRKKTGGLEELLFLRQNFMRNAEKIKENDKKWVTSEERLKK